MVGLRSLLICALLALLGACSMMPAGVSPTSSTPSIALTDRAKASDVVMYSYGLVDVGYRFGGSNPDAGLDCSGMVSYIVQQVTGTETPKYPGCSKDGETRSTHGRRRTARAARTTASRPRRRCA